MSRKEGRDGAGLAYSSRGYTDSLSRLVEGRKSGIERVMCWELAPLFHGRSSRRVLTHTASPGLYQGECHHSKLDAPACGYDSDGESRRKVRKCAGRWSPSFVLISLEIPSANTFIHGIYPLEVVDFMTTCPTNPPALHCVELPSLPMATHSARISPSGHSSTSSKTSTTLRGSHASRNASRVPETPPSPSSSPTMTISRETPSSVVSYANPVAGERSPSTFARSSNHCTRRHGP
uniref:Uncharacterized protein n=1 Tax=Mycena chlorophos TaxID=658473 RepID=A0ABQ0LL27_MYCCL|nr:predicted protein [Mycena chlorophos]